MCRETVGYHYLLLPSSIPPPSPPPPPVAECCCIHRRSIFNETPSQAGLTPAFSLTHDQQNTSTLQFNPSDCAFPEHSESPCFEERVVLGGKSIAVYPQPFINLAQEEAGCKAAGGRAGGMVRPGWWVGRHSHSSQHKTLKSPVKNVQTSPK